MGPTLCASVLSRDKTATSGLTVPVWVRLVFLACVVGALGWTELDLSRRVTVEAEALESVAAEAAAQMSAGTHATIVDPAHGEETVFLELRGILWRIKDRYGIRSPIYTLRRVDDETTEFVVMTNETPFIGHRYAMRPEMRPLFSAAGRGHTGLFRDAHGWWISGYGALCRGDGSTEALVCVDRPSSDLAEARTRGRLMSVLMGAGVALLAWGLQVVTKLKTGPISAIRQLLLGRLAIRIGTAGSLAVLVAVGIVGGLDHRRATEEMIAYHRDRLLAAVEVGVAIVDPALHLAVGAEEEPESVAFRGLQKSLRFIQQAARLNSPVYTLRRSGSLVHFVGMTNEVPFIGDTHELRPGIQATFDGAGPDADGPYSDAHGTWISAWAPILDPDGAVVGVLQADTEVSHVITALVNRSLGRALFALVGVLIAFATAGMLGRGIARPVKLVAQTASRIEEGEFDVQVPEDRIDEVGDLSRAINQMARGLRERSQLRDMFGKYMATQVVQDLLRRREIELTGEMREITVLMTDIRGYTALTEELGAAEIV